MIIENVKVFPIMEPRDIEVENGLITKVSKSNKDENKILTYPLVDSINLNRYSFKGSSCVKESVEQIINRCIENGTKYVRFDMMAEDYEDMFSEIECIREKYTNEITVLYAMTFSELNMKLFDKYRQHLHSIKAVANKNDNSYNLKLIKSVIDLALEFDKYIILELENTEFVEYVTEEAYKKGFGLKLSLVLPKILNLINCEYIKFNDMLARIAKSKASIMMSPSNELITLEDNMRGTDIVSVMDAGINIYITSGNVRDHINPYGNCNLLEEALTTAQLHKLDTNTKANKLYNAISLNGAEAMGIENYGIEVGCKADFIVYEAESIKDVMFFNS